MQISRAHHVQLRQLVLCEYPDCVKNKQQMNERVYALLGTQWNTLYPDCQTYTCSEWAWLYGSGYALKCIAPLFQLVPGIFTLASFFVLMCCILRVLITIGVQAYTAPAAAAATTATGNLWIRCLPFDQSQSVLHAISQNTLLHFRL